MKRLLIASLLAATLAACGASSGPQATADSVTKAVYNNDAASVSTNFDDALKQQITPASVQALSGRLRKLGDYKGLTYLSTDSAKRESEYRANFTNGLANIVLRLDAAGKVSAFRVFPLK